MNKVVVYTAFTFASSAVVLGNAFSHSNSRAEFFGLILRSKISLLLLMNLAYCILFLFGKVLQHLFFGPLRGTEAANLSEFAINFILFKLIFIVAILEPDLRELLIWTAWFSLLGFFKLFSLLARDRFGLVSSNLANTPNSAHYKILFFLGSILLSDLCWLWFCISTFGEAGASVLFLLTFECFTLFLEVSQTIVKYCIHLYDISLPQTWEHRGNYLYYTEFVIDSIVLFATLAHYVHILFLHGISFTLIDAALFLHLRTVFINLKQKIASYRNYRTIASYMRTRYPDVSPEELAGKDEICTICRDTLTSAKKLPCGHIFHFACLRQWLEAQHNCPTCRMSLIDEQYPQPLPAPHSHQQFPPNVIPLMDPRFNQNQNHNNNLNLNNHDNHDNFNNFNFNLNNNNNNNMNNNNNNNPMNPMGLNNNNNNNNLFNWLPGFVDILRRDELFRMNHAAAAPAFPVAPQDLQALREMFPHISADAIAADLARTGSIEATSENILEGRVFELPAAAAQQQNPAGVVAPNPIPNPNPNFNPNPNVAEPQQSGSTPILDRRASFSADIVQLQANPFAATAEERQSSLLNRRQQMIELARRQYLARKAASEQPASEATAEAQHSPVSSSSSNHPQSTATQQETMNSSSSLTSSSSSSSSSSLSHNLHSEGSSLSSTSSSQDEPPMDEAAERRRLMAEAAERRFRRLTGLSPETTL